MPRVVTFSTCVSPRWNKPEPCAVGRIPTSEEIGRMSVDKVELLSGLNAGDQVVLSDMSAWDAYDRVRLQ